MGTVLLLDAANSSHVKNSELPISHLADAPVRALGILPTDCYIQAGRTLFDLNRCAGTEAFRTPLARSRECRKTPAGPAASPTMGDDPQ